MTTAPWEATGSAPARHSCSVTAPHMNGAPTVDVLDGSPVPESTTFTTSGTWSDPDGDAVTATVDYGDGGGEEPLTLASGTGVRTDPRLRREWHYAVSVTVTDDEELSATDASLGCRPEHARQTVSNVQGPVHDRAGRHAPDGHCGFQRVRALRTRTRATYDWGDARLASTSGTVTESGGSGSTSGSHTWTSPGNYTVTVTVTDDEGATGSTSTVVEVVARRSTTPNSRCPTSRPPRRARRTATAARTPIPTAWRTWCPAPSTTGRDRPSRSR